MKRLYIASSWTILFVVFCKSDVLCLKWAAFSGPVKDGSTIPACVNRSIALPWGFTLDVGEQVQDISWQYQKSGDKKGKQPELIAVYRSGDFLPTEAFSQRVQFLANAGLVLDDVTMADSGRYSVEVDVHNALKTFGKHEMAFDLVVADFFQVTQDPEPTYDNTTDSWHVQLKCGLFSSLHEPAGVTWMTPSGARKDSTSYKDGYLYLQLPNPVEGGTYTCRLPPNSSTPSPACLSDDAPLSKQQPTFTVDKVEVRLTLLEAENRQMKEIASRSVAFYAYLSSGKAIISPTHVIMDTVVTNEGNSYNQTTGEFIAPYSGLYFFAATSATDSQAFDLHMKVDSRVVGRTASDHVNSYETSTCHVTVYLTKGQKVWLQHYYHDSTSQYFYGSMLTSFTGYLVGAKYM